MDLVPKLDDNIFLMCQECGCTSIRSVLADSVRRDLSILMNSGSRALVAESDRAGMPLNALELIALRHSLDESIAPFLARELDELIEQLPH